jgi:hypothetical protein
VFCGIDWSERHHDVAIVDRDGRVVAKRRVSDDVAGFGELMTLLAQAGDSVAEPIPVAIETGRGLLVAALRSAGRTVYSINPMAVARYRERRQPAQHGACRTLQLWWSEINRLLRLVTHGFQDRARDR